MSTLSSSPAPKKGLDFKQVVRYVAVGIANTVVDLSVLNGLILLSGTGRRGASYAIFKSIAFTCAMSNSYLLHRNWTFRRSGAKKQLLEGTQFLLIASLGALANISVAWYVATFASPRPDLARYWPTFSSLIGTASGMIFNFVGYKYFVFSASRGRRSEIQIEDRLAASAPE